MTQKRMFGGKREPEFFLSRGWKMEAIKKAALPEPTTNVSQASMRWALRAIHDHAGNSAACVAREAVLAQWIGWSTRHLRRVLRVLERAELVRIDIRNSRRGRVASRYTIDWQRVAPAAFAAAKSAAAQSQLSAAAEPAAQRTYGPLAPADVRSSPADVRSSPADVRSGDLNPSSNLYFEPPPPGPLNRFASVQTAGGEGNVGRKLGRQDLPEARSPQGPGPLAASDLRTRTALRAAFDRLAADPSIDVREGDRRSFVALVYCVAREVRQSRGTAERIRDPLALLNWRLRQGRFVWQPNLSQVDFERADREERESARAACAPLLDGRDAKEGS